MSAGTQDSIRTWYVQVRDGQYAALMTQHSKDFPGFDHSFENCLKLSSDTFTKTRYGFEGISEAIFYRPPIRVAIRNAIASTHPGWSWVQK